MKKQYPPPRAPLAMQELQALSKAADTPLERAVLYLLLDTAIRRSELLSIRLEHVDWEAGTILIHGKGGGFRLVAAGRRAMKALREVQDDQRMWRLSKSGVKRLLDNLAWKADVQNLYPHRLRVTRICDLITEGTDAISVGVVAGHSLEMVRYYQRAIEQRRALDVQRQCSLADRIA